MPLFSHLKMKAGSYQKTGLMRYYLGKCTLIPFGLLLVTIFSRTNRSAYKRMNFLKLAYIGQHKLKGNVRYLNYDSFCA